MILSSFDVDHINYWNTHTCSIDGLVTDIVNSNYGSQKLSLEFKFPRCKAFCFHELFLDYALTFSVTLEYMELRNQLREHTPYLEHIYEYVEI